MTALLALLTLGLPLASLMAPSAAAHECELGVFNPNPDDCGACEEDAWPPDEHYYTVHTPEGPIHVWNTCDDPYAIGQGWVCILGFCFARCEPIPCFRIAP